MDDQEQNYLQQKDPSIESPHPEEEEDIFNDQKKHSSKRSKPSKEKILVDQAKGANDQEKGFEKDIKTEEMVLKEDSNREIEELHINSKKESKLDESPNGEKAQNIHINVKSSKEEGNLAEEEKRGEINTEVKREFVSGGGKEGEAKYRKNSLMTNLLNIQLIWKNITIQPRPKRKCCKVVKQEKLILNSVTGNVKPGDFLAIIGASGSGKTTLLNFLSAKMFSRNLQLLQGEVYLNGVRRQDVDSSRFTAYVQQDDVLFETMTVRECLTFAAKLKTAGSKLEKERKVDELLDQLGLNHVANDRIGGALKRGISGGERKRTSIGVELITNPSLLFLDEPTTGLDSFTATKITEILSNLAKGGKTIICTIHQPNSDIYSDYFDKLMLLSSGKNKAKLAVDYFASIGESCGAHENPAEFFMKMLSKETLEHNIDESAHLTDAELEDSVLIEEKYEKRIDKLSKKYQNSTLKCGEEAAEGITELTEERVNMLKYQAGWCSQFNTLYKRSTLNIVRIPAASFARLIIILIVSFLAVALYWDLTHEGFEAIQDRNGALFFLVSSCVMTALQNVILNFPEERAVFMREQASSLYSVSAYFLSKLLADMPFHFALPLEMGAITYFLIGFNTEEDAGSKFLIFLLALEATYFASASYSLFIGSVISNRTAAVTLIPVIMVPLMLLSGYFVNLDNITVLAWPFQYISTFKYSYNILANNEYMGNEIIINGINQAENILNDMAVQFEIWECFVALMALFFLFDLLAFLGLKINSKRV